MNLNLLAPINFTGYGYVGLNILKALISKGIKVSLFPMGTVQAESQYSEVLNRSLADSLFYNNQAPSLRIYHQHDLSLHAGKGAHVGFPIFELDHFEKPIVHQMNSLDHLFVTSQWAKNVCVTNGVSCPISIVNLGVDADVFRDDPFYGRGDPYDDKPVVFLNCGKWEYRKGHDVILKAFERAFDSSDNVKLVMNCFNPCSWIIPENYNREWEFYYKNSKMGSKIEVIDQRMPFQADVVRLMQEADCGVFPSRAEGWNLELLEMMALGKPVITTSFSAHTEYANNDNAMLVSVNANEQAFDGVFFKNAQEKGRWAELGNGAISQIAEYMRHIYNCRMRSVPCYNGEGVETARGLTWNHTVEQILEVLK